MKRIIMLLSFLLCAVLIVSCGQDVPQIPEEEDLGYELDLVFESKDGEMYTPKDGTLHLIPDGTIHASCSCGETHEVWIRLFVEGDDYQRPAEEDPLTLFLASKSGEDIRHSDVGIPVLKESIIEEYHPELASKK